MHPEVTLPCSAESAPGRILSQTNLLDPFSPISIRSIVLLSSHLYLVFPNASFLRVIRLKFYLGRGGGVAVQFILL
jgi:hypothetical protein